jgi:ankyrin repeat protein
MDGITEMLFEALARNDLKAIQTALGSGANVRATNRAGQASMHIAAMKCNNSLFLRLLASCGADINARDCAGRTPLHWAGLGGNDAMILMLLALGADRSIPDGDGRLPRIRSALGSRTGLALTPAALSPGNPNPPEAPTIAGE